MFCLETETQPTYNSRGMSNQEVMVVLSDSGKPFTVIRALDDNDDVISRPGQRSAGTHRLVIGKPRETMYMLYRERSERSRKRFGGFRLKYCEVNQM